MKTEDEYVGIQNPAFVVYDVARRNAKYEDNWTESQKLRAVKMKNIIYELYGCRPRVFMNYRKDFIAIKVNAPKPSEKSADQVVEFNKMLSNGNLVKDTDGGVVYEFRCI